MLRLSCRRILNDPHPLLVPGVPGLRYGNRAYAGCVYFDGVGMTDREMLEFAAKAAGMRVGYEPDGKERGRYDLYWSNVHHQLIFWNPLIDDGDALRLAVKLKLETEFGSNFVNVGSSHRDSEWHIARESDVDLYVATRLAIVRAASEIGRNMND